MAVSQEDERLSDVRRSFSPSVNEALSRLESLNAATPTELLREFATVHPDYAGKRLGQVRDIDTTRGNPQPVAAHLEDVLALHDIAAMSDAGETLHTRTVVVDLAELHSEVRSLLGDELIDILRSEIQRDYRRVPAGSPATGSVAGQKLSPSMIGVLSDAQILASNADSPVVELDHLVGALVEVHNGTNELVQLLENFGVSATEVLELGQDYGISQSQVASQQVEDQPSGRRDRDLSESSQGVMDIAGKLAATLSVDQKTGISYLRVRDVVGGVLYSDSSIKDRVVSSLARAGAPVKKILDSYPHFLAESYEYPLTVFLSEQRYEKAARRPLPRDIADIVYGHGEPYAGFVHDDTRGRDLISEDRLNIAPHVRALSLLMASKDLDPPLAVGLFGDWGSGKTYFMRAVQQEVDRITRQARESGLPQRDLPVYRNVVQVEFNAWHYVDSDLWASLTDYIFTNLRIDERESLSEVERRRRLYVDQLKEKGAALRQAEAERAYIEGQVERSEKHLARIEREQAQRVGLADVLAAAITIDTDTAEQVNNLSRKIGLPEVGATAGELQESLDEARDVVVHSNSTLQTLEGRYGARWLMVAVLGLLLGPAALLISGAFDWTAWTRASSTLAAFAGGVALLLKAGAAAASTALSKIKNLDAEMQRQIRESDEVTEQTKRIEDLNDERNRLLETERDLKEKLWVVERDLAQLSPGHLLADFILSRQNSDDYRKHLGLASLIRRDFKELADHIHEFNLSLEETPREPDEGAVDRGAPTGTIVHTGTASTPSEADYHINRIILYIDDLDRCPPQEVVKVLQAVHLLLYFRLFIVVVGVDARWLSRSLEKHYAGLLGGHSDGSDPAVSYARSATPHDYLEKIFQIPFWLRPMTRNDQSGLLSSLTGKVFDDLIPGDGSTQSNEIMKAGAGASEETTPADFHPSEGDEATASALTPDDPGMSDTARVASPPLYELRTEQIDIDVEEREFMEAIRPLLGRSPRSLTRFVNVYRLIKAVALNEDRGNGNVNGIAESEIGMFLLAIVTGMPRISRDLFRELFQEDTPEEGTTLGDLVARSRATSPGPEVKTEPEGPSARDEDIGIQRDWQELSDWLDERTEWKFAHVDEWGDWARRVSRYSYRIEQR
jgi:hypothetical protein